LENEDENEDESELFARCKKLTKEGKRLKEMLSTNEQLKIFEILQRY